MHPESFAQRETIVSHTGPVFRVEVLSYHDPSGRRVRRDVVRHPGAVTVVAVRDDGRLVLIRNRRVAVDRTLIEFCAGKLEPGEDPAAAARRELVEECGYRAGRIEPLGEFFTSPGFADERMRVYLATGLEAVERQLEPGEEIEVFSATPLEVEAMIRDGRIEDGKTIAAWARWRLAEAPRP